MQVVVLANETQKAELMKYDGIDVVWIEDENDFLQYPSADAYLDLEYLNLPKRNAVLKQLLPKPVIINSVIDTLEETNTSFIRINAWETFFSSPVLEASCHNEEDRKKAEEIFLRFHKTLEWLPDDPGFITARVVSMIINEAFLAVGEGVSTEEEINTAMKLGTAYPFGPFEWARRIGVQNIVTLLQKLSEKQHRYTLAELLVQETDKAI
jgi:3-hydroxybutyryl-CoA dehydrogenase